MGFRFQFIHNGRSTSWNCSLKTFLNYPSDKQIHLLYALECSTSVQKEMVRNAIKLGPDTMEATELMNFVKGGAQGRPAPEISIVSCILAKQRRDSCAICLERMNDLGTMVVATSCRHVFCRNCIIQWASKHKTCPVCRGNTDKTLIHLGERDMKVANEIMAGGQAGDEDEEDDHEDAPKQLSTTERIFRELNII